MKRIFQNLIFLFCIQFIPLFSIGQNAQIPSKPDRGKAELVKLDNPITVDYLAAHLAKKSPIIILTPEIEKNLKKRLKTDLVLQNYYKYLQREATQILEKPLLKYELEGFRLLAVSREMVERMSILSMVYRLEKDPLILKRIDDEVKNVCAFQDWNTQHFLDVSEMSFAVALATDWVGEYLPKATVNLAKTALIEKGILQSFNESGPRMSWINGTNNWNSVCHGGLVAASLVIADVNPELAAKTIARALDKLPNSLEEYNPDGVYPEGPTYWGYGTSYAIIASNSLSTALGSDFGISKSPGFMESVNFQLQATAPSGDFFNFADSGDKSGGDDFVLRIWFAAKTGDALYFNQQFFENPSDAGRLAGLGLVWLSQFSPEKKSELPLNWCGKGINPVAVFRGENGNPEQFYLAAKGGKAGLSHGNMDAGTFIFDLNGVRWVLDPGNQNYYLLNKIGFNLSGGCQDCPRWTLMTKSNIGHSTITVNDARFNATGYAPITDFKTGEKPEVTIDMSEIYKGLLNSAQRRFIKENNHSILVEDKFEINDSTRNITWAIMTVADVLPMKNGAILKQDGKELRLSILSPENLEVSILSLDPPPLAIDKTIKGLKRIEIRVPAYVARESGSFIKVRLSDK